MRRKTALSADSITPTGEAETIYKEMQEKMQEKITPLTTTYFVKNLSKNFSLAFFGYLNDLLEVMQKYSQTDGIPILK